MLEEMKSNVCIANKLLPEYGLITFTWGNVSAIDRKSNLVVIKPSGVEYEEITAEGMVVINMAGETVDGHLKPSSDMHTHLELYRKFTNIGSVVHTHSNWATIFAQAGRGIPAYGTTHGDYFFGEIPCTRSMTETEIKGSYELETGRVIVETFVNLDPYQIPAVLVKNHGPFIWGKDVTDAVHNAVVLENLAKMAYYTESISLGGKSEPMPQFLLDKHYLRKHGVNAYYGQNK
jgi:L-ribulose-5-phosphate 4-epimerase